jgi:hypothetical protein
MATVTREVIHRATGRVVCALALTIEEPLVGTAIQTLPQDRWQPPRLTVLRGGLAFAAPAQGVASPIFDGWSIFIH